MIFRWIKKCKICGKEEDLVEHHISYEPEQTIWVCDDCHRRIHFLKEHPLCLPPKRVIDEHYGRKFEYNNPRKILKKLKKIDDIRHRIMISLFFMCGLKAKEFHKLKFKDVNIKKGFISVRNSKHHPKKYRKVPLPKDLREDFKKFLEDKKVPPNQKLFDISTSGMEWVVRKYFDNSSPLKLRNTFALICIKEGVNAYSLKEILGLTRM